MRWWKKGKKGERERRNTRILIPEGYARARRDSEI